MCKLRFQNDNHLLSTMHAPVFHDQMILQYKFLNKYEDAEK